MNIMVLLHGSCFRHAACGYGVKYIFSLLHLPTFLKLLSKNKMEMHLRNKNDFHPKYFL